MDEIEIPWILAGPGIIAGRELTTPVNTYDTTLTYDTTATVAYNFWSADSLTVGSARPVVEAFSTDLGQAGQVGGNKAP